MRAAGLLASALLLAGCAGLEGEGASVPTQVIQRGVFQHSVTAEGNLEAVDSTTVSVPKTSVRSYTVAWVAEDASPVRKDEIIVVFERDQLAGLMFLLVLRPRTTEIDGRHRTVDQDHDACGDGDAVVAQ